MIGDSLLTLSNGLAVLAGIGWLSLAAWGKYDRWWWYDLLAHGLAGVTIGGLAAAHPYPLWRAVAVSMLAAVVWEWFEYFHGIHPWRGSTRLNHAWEDTLSDTFVVLVGAVLAGFVVILH